MVGRAGLSALVLWLSTTPALAQEELPSSTPGEPQPAPEPSAPEPSAPEESPASDEPPASDELTAEELEEIERALAGDETAQEQGGDTPPPAAPAPAAPFFAGVQSLNPDISLLGDFALAAFSEEENLQSGGHDPTASGFNLQQLELTFGASVDPYFRFDANIVFAQSGVEIEEAYATSLALPGGFQTRIGQFLTRFGRFNPTHLHAWEFVDQPFIIGRFLGGEGNRGLGIEASYLTPLPWYVELVGSVTDASGEATARSFYGGQNLGVSSPLDFQFTGAVKQFWDLTDDLSLLVGVSGANGPNPTGHRARSDLYGVDLYLKYRPLTQGSPTVLSFQAEGLYRRRQIPDEVLSDFGGYATVFWKFAPTWSVAGRYEFGSPALLRDGRTAGDLDYLDADWTGDRHRVSANGTWWLTEFSRARLQLSADYPRFRPQPIYAAFLAFEVAIGAHGAHKF